MSFFTTYPPTANSDAFHSAALLYKDEKAWYESSGITYLSNRKA
jgi:hypothetical protein